LHEQSESDYLFTTSRQRPDVGRGCGADAAALARTTLSPVRGGEAPAIVKMTATACMPFRDPLDALRATLELQQAQPIDPPRDAAGALGCTRLRERRDEDHDAAAVTGAV